MFQTLSACGIGSCFSGSLRTSCRRGVVIRVIISIVVVIVIIVSFIVMSSSSYIALIYIITSVIFIISIITRRRLARAPTGSRPRSGRSWPRWARLPLYTYIYIYIYIAEITQSLPITLPITKSLPAA